jgi:hypothetical protein
VLTIKNEAGVSVEFDYEEIIFVDFEFVPGPGTRPQVVCVAWYTYTTRTTQALWIDELGALPPFRTDSRVLYVCFVANAEIGCHLALDWPIPKNIVDLNAEFRNLTNGHIVPAGKGLIGALTYYCGWL